VINPNIFVTVILIQILSTYLDLFVIFRRKNECMFLVQLRLIAAFFSSQKQQYYYYFRENVSTWYGFASLRRQEYVMMMKR